MYSLLSFLCLACVHVAAVAAQTPPQLLDSVVKTMIARNASDCAFFKYKYGGAIIMDSMYKAMLQFSSANAGKNVGTNMTLDYGSTLGNILNDYLIDPWTPAYKIANDIDIPFSSGIEGAIGDTVGLFPINYLQQIMYEYRRTHNAAVFDFQTVQWKVIFTTADHYILQFPRRLKDGTVSRNSHASWENQPDVNASFVWADDNFMGFTLLTRLALALQFCMDNVPNDCNHVDANSLRKNITTYVDAAYQQNILFNKNLLYSGNGAGKFNGLYAHGYNGATNDHTCCPWGRANAWILTAHIEGIKMFDSLMTVPHKNNVRYNYTAQLNALLSMFRNQCNELHDHQDSKATGMWRQVLNDTTTFVETSSTTGYLYGLIYGRVNNLLPTNAYSLQDWDAVIHLAYNTGMKTVIVPQKNASTMGQVFASCEGTGLENDVPEYEARSTDYCSSGDPGGEAFVINAIVGYQQYLNFMAKQQ